ncbi:adrenocortical dysplasia protein homolog [Sphaeramia orbicularis]|uniref:Uncharacterized LOC115421656 n=1 Tax=Sphaeramia orbicularis TaxID=375764 RepID=A0A672YHJ7_9TELE|nr:uncharacterized protein LOC115421656 [Sphaeramia orbicularis]XP_029993517.1 uncharacterized protein LOC115421656 [Sphaeramia orbicularis]
MMPRPLQGRIVPWIERLVQGFGVAEGTDSSTVGRLKAHVIGVGQMSQSQAQAQGTEGPTGLLFLSDGVVQIPAVLTASAWDHLQDQEDRECFTSLVNTTVYIQDYQLQFHMAPEQTKSRFYLLIGKLATTSAGPIRTNTPCCTSLQSVRMKICKTWRSLLGQEDSQGSQCGFDLSDLLGEWQHDCLLTILDDVREKLMATRRRSLQPGTSTSDPSVGVAATRWDLDRVRYKGLKPFTVPVKQLLIPENLQVQNRQLQDDDGVQMELSENRNAYKQSESSTPSVDEAEWCISVPGLLDLNKQTDDGVPEEENMLDEDIFVRMLDSDVRPSDNPWDMFPRPCDTSSSSETSPPLTQISQTSHHTHTVFTSTQLPVHASEESQQPSLSKTEHSFFPPYQKLPPSPSNSAYPSSSSSSAPGLTEPSNPPILVQESKTQEKTDAENTDGSKCRKAKRKRCDLNPEMLSTVVEEEHEEAVINTSPPSWLFESQVGSEEGGAYCQGQTIKKQTPTVHSDGRPFSYSYQMSGDNLLDFSRFRVAESLLHWAVKYLVVPKNADYSCNPSVPAGSGGTEVSSA